MGKTLTPLIIGIIVGVVGLYAYQNPDVRSQVSEFVGGILNSVSEVPAPTPTAPAVVALPAPTATPTQVAPAQGTPVPTATPSPSPTETPEPEQLPTATVTRVPVPSPTPASYSINVVSVATVADGQVDFLLEVRNESGVAREEVAQVQMSVDGGAAEVVNIIVNMPAGEIASFAFARSLDPGPHMITFSVGDSHTIVSLEVGSDTVAVSALTPTPIVTVIPVPTLGATPLPTNTPPPTYTPAPEPTQTPVPTHTPKPTPTETSAERSMDDIVEEIEMMVHTFVNHERNERGLNELKLDSELGLVARKHSLDMAQKRYFSHDSPNGDGPDERASKAGYRCSGGYYIGFGENIYQGWLYSSVSYGSGGTRYDWLTPLEIATNAVMGWMDSPGHRRNILKPRYIRSGVGVAVSDDGKVLFTQKFC